MDKPPENKNAEIVQLFRQYEPEPPEPPEPPSARIVELPDTHPADKAAMKVRTPRQKNNLKAQKLLSFRIHQPASASKPAN